MPGRALDRQRLILAVEAMAESDVDHQLFGSTIHQYRFGPCLDDEAIRQVERQNQFSLPADYNEFISGVGNGGAGPGYGLWPLGQWDPMDTELEPWSQQWPSSPGRPFPHGEAWNLPPEILAAEPEADAPLPEWDAFAEKIDAVHWQTHLTDGAIPIANLGCAIRMLLVVDGEERGNVWIDDRASEQGIYPVATENKPRLTFADMYDEWIAGAQRSLTAGEPFDRLW